MHNTPAESNEQAPAGEQPDPILGGTVLPAELPTSLIIQPNTTVNSFARSRHRAQQRWCALLQRTFKSGVGNRLTSSQWDNFKQFAKAYYYDKFLAVLKPQDGLLKCVGPIEGGQCPANMVVDFTDANVLAELECLHIDHTYDINLICRTWLDLLPQRPVSWHENIDVEVLCHVLFSNRPLYAASKSKLFAPGIQLRCHTKEHKCHATGTAHYNYVLRQSDLAK